MSDGTLSTELENDEFTPSVEPQNDGPDESDAETARLVAQSGELADEEFLQYMRDAAVSGVGTGFLDRVQSGLGLVGKGIDSISGWMKSNPELSKTFLSGLSSGLKQKSDSEAMALRNQWSIDAENRKNAREDQLWQRKNDSITGMQKSSLGLIGQSMYDDHTAYLKSRK